LLRRPNSSPLPSNEKENDSAASDAAAIAAAIWQANQGDRHSCLSFSSADEPSRWKQEGRRAQLDREP
jgi:hypothetical protein